ncbi:NADH-quinone oxidoreductase subunit H (plasmid) [Rubrobacter tropicus]|uniref:NADH-quinone oxidoreductase subunit H n=1 Tax=Rubrobacter tropicus TaxID=2653851 RepID=A0A6G8QFV3_9ACTN|nr:complex I subunit 1 family protein [Rubrobacter tropicus]QIN85396.1 NADH-quinone oxidoreductase subunit H [Rubrobacter tropicus]
MTTLLMVLVLLAGAYLVAVLEGWVSTGRLRPAGPILSAVALLGRESLLPRKPDRIFFEVAPPLLLVSAVLAFAVLPLSPGLIAADLATGALFVNAALAFVMVALLMAGWGPDGAYAMVGGFRFLGQLVAYSMLIVMPITAVAMRAESLVTTAVVESQAALPNAVYQPFGLAAFLVAAMAVCFLPPFDLPTAPGELAGGVMAEYTGWRLAVMRLARAALVFTVAASVTVFYLGGWLGPVLPPWAWNAIKTLLVAAAMLLAGRFVPRLREEHLLAWCWKIGIPLALFNIFYVGVLLLVVG